MRNAVAGLIGLLIMTWVSAQAPAPAQPTTDGWARKMFIKDNALHSEHDFGTVPRGTLLSYRFPITNIYAVPMQVTAIRVSCGCVTATGPTKPLQPHETASIDLTMDARKFTGANTVSIHVTVGPQFISTATLRVKANSRADVVLNPGQINFGVVPQAQVPTQTVDVEYAGALDWKVTGIAPSEAPLELRVQELYRRPGQVGYRLSATLKNTAPAGPFKHEVQLQTNDPASPLVPVLIEAVVQAPLAVVPDAVNMGQVAIGQSVTRRVVVRGTNRPFRITSVAGQGDGVNVEYPTEARPVQILTITYSPTAAVAVRKQLTIKTDLDRESTVNVLVEGSGQ